MSIFSGVEAEQDVVLVLRVRTVDVVEIQLVTPLKGGAVKPRFRGLSASTIRIGSLFQR
jgi:hypothetical protein